MPYYGYSRQDRKSKSRQPISAKLVANLIEVAGATRVLAMDLHAGQIQGFFDIPIDNFRAMPIIVDYFKKKNFKDELVIVSPDHGGAVRARNLGEIMNAPIAIIDKRRPKPGQSQVMNVIGDVKGKTCIIVDDIIDSGGTIVNAAKALKERGAKEVYVYITHGVLSGEAVKKIKGSVIKNLVITDTIDNNNKKILSIGDNLNTDIKGANLLNYDSLLISNGVHKNEIKNNGIEKVSKQYESIVNFIQSDLKW